MKGKHDRRAERRTLISVLLLPSSVAAETRYSHWTADRRHRVRPACPETAAAARTSAARPPAVENRWRRRWCRTQPTPECQLPGGEAPFGIRTRAEANSEPYITSLQQFVSLVSPKLSHSRLFLSPNKVTWEGSSCDISIASLTFNYSVYLIFNHFRCSQPARYGEPFSEERGYRILKKIKENELIVHWIFVASVCTLSLKYCSRWKQRSRMNNDVFSFFHQFLLWAST